MEKVKVKYRGSANKLPKYNLKFKDGDEIEMEKKLADRLVGEKIGFSFIETPKEEEKEEEKPKREKIKKVNKYGR